MGCFIWFSYYGDVVFFVGYEVCLVDGDVYLLCVFVYGVGLDVCCYCLICVGGDGEVNYFEDFFGVIGV